ncbi:uncharacterized protein VDAG_09205 [Verticillium dahliae VdLs.17]|uniref:GH18 domain-containing protein n=1 Tax=Verticillium dahliae (strain VdLs.17 / ATCC MYA-4575 / FGSC 10137) TaxID=498257 RepID=G2XFT1_VERDV|nr:uncharacterized protein VDAG_09205 [Verticillium dahliae VdLs.17]EGY18679.1 hypothetical protein VDAG_09205 [Verticillium dahliae VdLs.17]
MALVPKPLHLPPPQVPTPVGRCFLAKTKPPWAQKTSSTLWRTKSLPSFSKTSIPRASCDALARELVDGDQVVPVAVQGACSYTVYAGPNLGHIVQFRLKTLGLKVETAALARQVFNTLAPDVSFKQQLGEDCTTPRREPLLVYVMAQNSPERKACRKNPMQDVARFFALAWKTPQEVGRTDCDCMAEIFQKELQMLLIALPDQLHRHADVSMASFSYDAERREFISYDTPRSVRQKISYLKEKGLAGSMFWEASGDRADENSLISMSSELLGPFTGQAQNQLDYPNSQYENIRAGME